MERVPQGGGSLGAVGSSSGSLGEYVPTLGVHRLTVQGSTHREHQLDVFVVPHGRDPAEQLEGLRPFTEAKEGLP